MTEQADLQSISGRLERGEIDSGLYLEQLMRFVAGKIACSRAALRLLVEGADGRVLRCVSMYDATCDRMVVAPDIAHITDSPYLLRLQRDGYVGAVHALTDPLTAGPLREYLRQAGIVSLMDMAFSVNGVLFGTFGCEQRGAPVDWSPRQLQVLRKVASRASLDLMHVVNDALDTAPGALWEPSTPNRLATMRKPLDTKLNAPLITPQNTPIK